MYPYILVDDDTLTIVIDNTHHIVKRSLHPKFEQIVTAIKASDWDVIPDLVDLTRQLANYSQGLLQVKDGDVYWDGKPFHNALTDRLLRMLEDDFPVEPLVNFLHNLKKNPSKRAVDELYGFLEVCNLPITPDGHFLAYKKVREDYKDCHSGTFDNSVGQVCSMPRNEVCEDKDTCCADGLHFCSMEYLKSFWGERLMILKINPADVVSIPSDYNNSKGRTWRYEVVGEHTSERNDDGDYQDAFDDVVDTSWDMDEMGEIFEEEDEPRAVYRDSQGRYRYDDNGQYASRDAYNDYWDWRDTQ